jgi:hypothetical protein
MSDWRNRDVFLGSGLPSTGDDDGHIGAMVEKLGGVQLHPAIAGMVGLARTSDASVRI